MTTQELRKALREIQRRQDNQRPEPKLGAKSPNNPTSSDVESDHANADQLLLTYINDPHVKAIWNRLTLWYT